MSASFSDYQPIRYVGRVPVYVTTIFTALLVGGLVASALLLTAQVSLAPYGFVAPLFLRGALWQVFTYPFIEQLTFFTPLGILCFYSWGMEVERYLGRARYIKFLGTLWLIQPIVCCLWWAAGVPAGNTGNYEITAALLIAFATLYPNVEFFGWIPLKWFAFACFAVGSMMLLPARDWVRLSLLWAECGAAFAFIRHLQRGGGVELDFDVKRFFRRRPKLRVMPPPPRSAARPAPAARRAVAEPEEDAVESINPLLDKIARSGLASLTAKERARLEKARAELLKKETDGR